MGKLITIIDAARRFGMSEQTMRNWIKEGYIFVKEVGRSRFIDEDTLDALQDTIEDINRQKAKLESLRAKIRAEYEHMWQEYTDDRNRRRYLNLMTGAAFRSGFFETVVHLLMAYGNLTDREGAILVEYLNGVTLESIAAEYGLTRERVRQIVEKAIRKSKDISEIEDRLNEMESLKTDNKALISTIEVLRGKLREQELQDALQNIKDEEERKKAIMTNDAVYRLMTTKLTDMNISVRALNGIKSMDIETIGDLCQYTKLDILKIRNLGKKTLAELDDLLEALGLEWGMNVEAILQQRVAMLLENHDNT